MSLYPSNKRLVILSFVSDYGNFWSGTRSTYEGMFVTQALDIEVSDAWLSSLTMVATTFLKDEHFDCERCQVSVSHHSDTCQCCE